MRKILLGVGALGALAFVLAVNAAAPANFAGTWTLDKSKSQGLNQRLQGAESVTWTITQDEKQITVEEKVIGNTQAGGGPPSGGAPGAPPAGGPPAEGRGGRVFSGGGGPRTYNLDGSEASFEMGQAKGARKAAWSSDSKTLELMTKATFSGPNGEVTSNSSDKMTLSADGTTLTVTRHSESPRGTQDSTLVFVKK